MVPLGLLLDTTDAAQLVRRSTWYDTCLSMSEQVQVIRRENENDSSLLLESLFFSRSPSLGHSLCILAYSKIPLPHTAIKVSLLLLYSGVLREGGNESTLPVVLPDNFDETKVDVAYSQRHVYSNLILLS
jgi:hypothetical protein